MQQVVKAVNEQGQQWAQKSTYSIYTCANYTCTQIDGGPISEARNSVKILTDFHFFFTGRFLGKFAVKGFNKNSTTLCICRHTTL